MSLIEIWNPYDSLSHAGETLQLKAVAVFTSNTGTSGVGGPGAAGTTSSSAGSDITSSDFVVIPSGTFLMGSPDDEIGREVHETPHEVTLTRDVLMQVKEVSQGQWKALSGGVNPACHQTNFDTLPDVTDLVTWSSDNPGVVDFLPGDPPGLGRLGEDFLFDSAIVTATVARDGITASGFVLVMTPAASACTVTDMNDDGPAEGVDWYSALAYANEASARAGFEACYALEGCLDPDGWVDGSHEGCTGATFVGLDCGGYRLPTEAEWEYAARAGTTEATYAGDLTSTSCRDASTLDAIAWHCGNSGNRTRAVGTREPNGFGLHDMLGNVDEWVWDVYGEYPVSATDPTGPEAGEYRVSRGGGISLVEYARAAARNWATPNADAGFRLVRTIPR